MRWTSALVQRAGKNRALVERALMKTARAFFTSALQVVC